MDVLSNQNDSPYINEVDVVPPSPQSAQRDLEFRQSPYLQDYNQDFGLPNSLGSPSFSPSFNGSYYSPYSDHSELSYGGEHDINLNIFDNDSNTGLGLRTEYDPTEFDGPQVTSSSLLIYNDNEFMPQYSTLTTTSKQDSRSGNPPYDYSSPSSNASGNEDHVDKRSRASSVSSNHANAYHPSPRLDVAQSFENMSFRSPGWGTEPLPRVSPSPAPPKPLSPPRLMMPDDHSGDGQEAPKINAPDGDGDMGGPHFNIVPATPVGGGSSVANQVPFQSSLETLRQGSTLGLQPQQWHGVDQQSGPTTGRSSSVAIQQEFTFPSRGHDNPATGAASSIGPSHMGQVVDDSVVGVPSNLLQMPQRTRSKSDTSREMPTWDQSFIEQQQRQLGGMGGSAVIDDQTVNMNDVLPGTQQSQLNPGFTFGQGGAKPNTTFLSPDLNPLRRAKSDGSPRPVHRQSRSEDVRGSNLIPPASQPGHQHSHSSGQFLFPPQPGQMDFLTPGQQFFNNSTGSPEGPLPSISGGRSMSPGRSFTSSPGHIRRASSGTRSERGAEAWSGGVPTTQHRISPYPSPHTSPHPRVNELPYDDSYASGSGGLLSVEGYGVSQPGYGQGYSLSGTYTPSSTGASAYHTPGQSPSPGPPLPMVDTAVPKQTVTTGRTANASHKRRKQEATFVCPIHGCGSTFTRSFNLKGHIRSHKEEKPFVCHWPGCGKGFARQHDCKRHEQLHTNFRPFSCDGCGKQFARMDALNRHLRSEGGADCQKLQDVNGSDSDGMSGGKIGVGGGVTKVEDKSWATGLAL